MWTIRMGAIGLEETQFSSSPSGQASNRYRVAACLIAVLAGCILVGCQPAPEADTKVEKPPKPVHVLTLSRTRQIQKQLITGSIAPWKTEQIGFEIAGRLSFVIERNEEVTPELPGVAGAATPLARVDSERFEIALATAEADVEVARRRWAANQVAIERRLPAVVASAESELETADAEYRRAIKLSDQNAIAPSEFDAAKNRWSAARSALTGAQSQLAQAEAEQAALQAQVLRAAQDVKEAERNLRSTSLYSSFRGLVSEVHRESGAYVKPGDPVATVQMMDPMLVEFEVSPDDVHKYAKGDILDVLITGIDGNRKRHHGMVYTVDAIADSSSRTYTVALHIRNQKQSVTTDLPSSDACLPSTERIYSLDVGPVIVGESRLLVEKSCLHKIGGDTVIWKILNRRANAASNPKDRTLLVEPVKVTLGQEVFPLLGQWEFVPVRLEDGVGMNLKNDLITGKVTFPDAESSKSVTVTNDAKSDLWGPRRVILRHERWLLRSGDVVQIGMSGSSLGQGFFVPMRAIFKEGQKTYLHVVEYENGDALARRIEVVVQVESVFADSEIRVEVRPVEGGWIGDGSQIVVGGSHYLTDGDRVNVVDGGSH